MTTHAVGTREYWRAAYEQQLAQEKELTRRATELAKQRQELPWVPVDKQYRFDTTTGQRTLAELFGSGSGCMLDVMELMALSCFALQDGVAPHVLDLRSRHRGAQRDLATAGPGTQRPWR